MSTAPDSVDRPQPDRRFEPQARVVDLAGVRAGRDEASLRIYEAEMALHIAHQSGVDAWVAAAADRLHHVLVQWLPYTE